MIALLQNDLELARRKLQYYNELKAKNPSKKSTPADRWIEIYDERVHKIEKQIAKLHAQAQAAHSAAEAVAPAKPGLKTQVSSNSSSSKARSKSRA